MAFGGEEPALARRIAALVALARDEEAGRLLGLEGVLEGQLDVTFIDDPLDWVAYDIAQAIKASEDEAEDASGPTLSLLVGEIRLLRILRGEVDEPGLTRMVRQFLEESD